MKENSCSQTVYRSVLWASAHACGRTGKVEVNGKWYCGIHDPRRAKERQVAASAKRQEKLDANRARQESARALASELGCGTAHWSPMSRTYTGGIVLSAYEAQALIERLRLESPSASGGWILQEVDAIPVHPVATQGETK